MKTRLHVGMILMCSLMVFTTTLSASQEGRGLRMFDQTIKKACGTNAFEFARTHTQAEWKSLYESNGLDAELKKICPEAKPFKEEYKPDLYAFLYAVAKDSGKIFGA